jgi:FkbM family methyltransferase
MYLDATDLPQLFVLAHGEWEPETAAAIRQHLGAGDCFVDIGANAGYFSLLAASIVGPEGRVLAFEPNPEIRTVLLENIGRSGYQNIEVCPACCADSPGRVKLFLNRSHNSGGCSMSSGNAASNIAIEVDAIRADSGIRQLPKPPAMVKIDTEGAEALVLRGMAETLRAKPAIILEIDERLLQGMGSSSEEVRSLLDGYRFECAGFNYVATARPPDEKAARQSTAAR